MRFVFPRIADAKDHILTALILVFAIFLMVSRFQGGLNNLRTVSITLFSYLEEPLSSIRVYRQALKTNTELRRQNVLLLDELSRLRSSAQDNKRLRELLNYREQTEYPLESVVFVGKELTGIQNSLTIDAGSNQGVEVGMPVVSADGLVGRVILTTGQYAQVMPFFNSLFKVSARIQGIRAYGVVSWEGKSLSRLIMKYVPQTIPVDSGRVIETSGYSNQFPPGIPIGRVTGTEPETGKETQRIYLKPFVSLHEIAEGFVIKYQPDSSLKRLMEKYNQEFE